MKILDRYIAVHVVWGTLLALTVLLALFTFVTFVDDLGEVGRGTYTLTLAFEYLLLTMPTRAFNLFPMAALVGSLFGLGILSGNAELTVIRASGVSVLRIVGSVMKAAAILVLAAMIIGEGIAPYTEQLAQYRRSVAISDKIALRADYGFWVRDGLSFINIRRVGAHDQMGDVYVYEFDRDHRLRVASHADRAVYHDGHWTLEGITQSLISDNGVTTRKLDRAEWKTSFSPDLVNASALQPEDLSIFGLMRYLRYLRRNDLSTERLELAFWSKLSYPLSTGIMIFFAVPLVLGHLRSVGVGQRILVGALLGIVFHVVDQAAGHMGLVYRFSPAASALFSPLLFLGIGTWLLRRVR